jgi:hypothetical protein
MGRVDRRADWLLAHCPYSTLTLLTTLICGSPNTMSEEWPILAVAVIGDVGINLFRWRRAKRSAVERTHDLHRSATA